MTVFIIRRLLHSHKEDNLFGLTYSFKLTESSDEHKKGVGDAVNLPEWLCALPLLKELGAEVGLEMKEANNFHQFYSKRQGNERAMKLLQKMTKSNNKGAMSKDEWDIAGLYVAVKFSLDADRPRMRKQETS